MENEKRKVRLRQIRRLQLGAVANRMWPLALLEALYLRLLLSVTTERGR